VLNPTLGIVLLLVWLAIRFPLTAQPIVVIIEDDNSDIT